MTSSTWPLVGYLAASLSNCIDTGFGVLYSPSQTLRYHTNSALGDIGSKHEYHDGASMSLIVHHFEVCPLFCQTYVTVEVMDFR